MARILGYVYDNTNTKYGSWTGDDQFSGYYNPQTNQWYSLSYPQAISKNIKLPDSKAIPIYEPPIPISFNGQPLSDQQKFEIGASIAGAADAKPIKPSRGQGLLDSNFITGEQRQQYGLPSSFDMLRNIDPTSQTWGFEKSQVYNPQAGGSGFKEFFAGAAPYVALFAGAASLGSILSATASTASSAAAVAATATEAAIDTAGLAGGLAASGISVPMALPSFSQLASFAVQAAINPVAAIESAALTSMGVPAALTQATVALANGASLKQVIQSAGLNEISAATENSVVKALSPTVSDKNVVNALAGAASSALTTAMVTGGDVNQSLKAAAISAAQNYGLPAIVGAISKAADVLGGILSSASEQVAAGGKDLVQAVGSAANAAAGGELPMPSVTEFKEPTAAPAEAEKAPTITPETALPDVTKPPTFEAPAQRPTEQAPALPGVAPAEKMAGPPESAAQPPSPIMDMLQKSDKTFPTYEAPATQAPAPTPVGSETEPKTKPEADIGEETGTKAAAPKEQIFKITLGPTGGQVPPETLPIGLMLDRFAQYGPGSQALAQALRIGDVGAPIFGGEKEGKRKPVWNVKSLRVKDEVGQ